jgi:hypothetical protein
MASLRQRVHTDLFEPEPQMLQRPPSEDGPAQVQEAPPQVRFRRLREVLIVALLALVAVLPALAMSAFRPHPRWPLPQPFAPSPRPGDARGPPTPLPYLPPGGHSEEISNETEQPA